MFNKLFGRDLENRGVQNKKARDPICGMMVDQATALKSEIDGETYYFCSPHCQQTFELQQAQ